MTRLWAVAALVAGCGGSVPRTEVVVSVHSDLALGSALASARVSVLRARDATPPLAPLEATDCVNLGEGPADLRLPLRLGIGLKSGAAPSKFVVIAKGYNARDCALGVPLVDQAATVSFVPDQRRLLDLTLAAACVGLPCPDGKTCRAGACADDAVDPLPPFAGAPDGSDPTDGAPWPRG